MDLKFQEKHKIIHENCFYDIIGDIHGNARELEVLLGKLGYANVLGVWTHPERKAIFVGDFIDRGPNSRKVLVIVKSMVDYGSAYAVLGNHELNAILYLTKENGKSIRKPSESSRKLIEKVKSEFDSDPELFKTYIKWLRKLPLFLDFGKFRVVHAYWNDKYIAEIDKIYKNDGKLRKYTLKNLADPNHPISDAINRTTKGIECRLPDDLIIKDSKNIRRNSFRIKWWESPEGKTFREISYGNKFKLPEYTVPRQILFPFEVYEEKKPIVFFGHYCMNKVSLNPRKNICCVDGCIASGGTLVAYRWNGETEINKNNFVYVQPSFSLF